MDLLSLSAVGPELFLLSSGVVADDGVGCVQHVLGGPVVLLQAYDQGFGIDLLEVQNVVDIGAPEAVDGLVVVTDHAEVAVPGCQKTDQLELGVVGILVLIHHDIAEAVLVVLQHFRMGVEQVHGLHQKVVKIQGVVLLQDFLVFLIAVADLSAVVVPSAHMVLPVAEGTDQFVLGGRDGSEDLPLLQLFGVDPQALADIFHDRLLIIRIIDRKGILVAQQVDMTAQDPDAHGMEGRDPDAFRPETDQAVHPVPHFAGCLIGKCNGQDVPGVDLTFLHQIGDPVGNDPGLAAAGTGQNKNRPFCLADGLLLFPVQGIIYAHTFSCCLLLFGHVGFIQKPFQEHLLQADLGAELADQGKTAEHIPFLGGGVRERFFRLFNLAQAVLFIEGDPAVRHIKELPVNVLQPVGRGLFLGLSAFLFGGLVGLQGRQGITLHDRPQGFLDIHDGQDILEMIDHGQQQDMVQAVFLTDRGNHDFVLDIVIDHGLGHDLVCFRVAGGAPQVLFQKSCHLVHIQFQGRDILDPDRFEIPADMFQFLSDPVSLKCHSLLPAAGCRSHPFHFSRVLQNGLCHGRAAQEPCQFPVAFRFRKPADMGHRPAAAAFLGDQEVTVLHGRDLWQVGNAEDLVVSGQTAHFFGHFPGGLAADAGIDLIENKGVYFIPAGKYGL